MSYLLTSNDPIEIMVYITDSLDFCTLADLGLARSWGELKNMRDILLEGERFVTVL